MRRPGLFWAAAGAGLAGLDLWCDRNATTGDTLSEVARTAFRTHTPLGRVAFVSSWALLTGWLIPHICRTTDPSRECR